MACLILLISPRSSEVFCNQGVPCPPRLWVITEDLVVLTCASKLLTCIPFMCLQKIRKYALDASQYTSWLLFIFLVVHVPLFATRQWQYIVLPCPSLSPGTCADSEYSSLLVSTQLWFLYPSQVLKSADIQGRDIKGCNTVGPAYPWLPEDLQTTVEVDWIMDVKSIDAKGQLYTETVWLWNIKNTGPTRLQNTASNSHLIFRYFPRKWPRHERPLYWFGERENTA